MHRLRYAAAVLVAALAVTSVHAEISELPIRIVFNAAAGSAGDVLVRNLATSLHISLDRPVIVENKVGAGGRIGVLAVKDAPADGSVLLLTPVGMMCIYPHVYEKLGYDPVADFQPISQIATFDLAMAVGPIVPAKSLQALVDWLKLNPLHGSYGTPAAGSQPHFLAAQFARTAGLDLRHVAYKGSSLAIADMIGGHLPIYFGPTQEFIETHRAGHITVLATTGTKRSAVLTDVPTFMESGYDIRGEVWFGVYAPAKTPPEVVAPLNKAIVAAVQAPELRRRMQALGMQPTGTSSAELARIQLADLERWGPIVKASGFKPAQ